MRADLRGAHYRRTRARDDGVKAGFLMPDPSGNWDPTNPENYPETWVRTCRWRMARQACQKKIPAPVGQRFRSDGVLTSDGGLHAWFIPAASRFNDRAVSPTWQQRDSLHPDLAVGRGAENSATTMLTLASLRYLYETRPGALAWGQESARLLGQSA